jgi:hypothetical protein
MLISLTILLGGATAAYADCHYETYTVNGQISTCWVCWFGGQKTVTCS